MVRPGKDDHISECQMSLSEIVLLVSSSVLLTIFAAKFFCRFYVTEISDIAFSEGFTRRNRPI